MKLYGLYLRESLLYWIDRLQVLVNALSVVYSAPMDIGLTRRERRRRILRYDSPPLPNATLGTGRLLPPALGTIAF